METITVYKLFRVDPDGLHTLFIDPYEPRPIGQWMFAQAPDEQAMSKATKEFALIDLETQDITAQWDRRPNAANILMAEMRGERWTQIVKGKLGKRLYYDLGISSNGQVIRFAHRKGWHTCRAPSLPGVNMADKVWAECLIPAEGCQIVRRNINGMTHQSQQVEWLVSQAIYIVRLLDDSDIDSMCNGL